jgi:PAS domain S-box-containing protein
MSREKPASRSAPDVRFRPEDDAKPSLRLLAASAQDGGTLILQLLSAAVEHSPDGVVVSISDLTDSSELQIVYTNPAFEALAAASPSTLTGQDPLAVVGDLVDGPTRTALADAVSQRTPLTMEYTRDSPGSGGFFELRAVPISGGAEPLTEWVWIFRDITRRVREERSQRVSLQEELRERSQSLAEAEGELRIMQRLAPLATLAAGLGHDMSNLLLPMRAHLEALATAVREPSAVEHVDALHSVLRYIQQLTDSLRLMALDPDRPLVSGKTTDLHEWWETTEPLLSSVIRPSVHLGVGLPEGLPPVRVAPHLLTLAVLNLLVNANEAIDGEGEIRVWARPERGGAEVHIGVTDDGRGMSPEVRERAFDPFFSTKRRHHATGFGLPLVHGVVRAAQGVVKADSREGGGTTVTLTLPVAEAATVSSSHRTERTAVVRVDDERIAALLRTMLIASGFTPGADPATCSVLVTDPSPGALDEVRDLRARAAGVQVFVYGAGGAEWDRLGATLIERDAGPSAIRRAFSRLMVVADGGDCP